MPFIRIIGIVGVKELILRHENSSLKKELESATEEIRLKSLKIDIKEKGIKENNDILDDDLTIIGIGKWRLKQATINWICIRCVVLLIFIKTLGEIDCKVSQ